MRDWLAIDVMSCLLGDQKRLYDGLLSGGETANAQKFVAWGSPDLLLVSRLPGVKEAKAVYHRHVDSGIFDRQIYFGHVIDGPAEDLGTLTARLPLIGVSFLKINDVIIREMPEGKLGFASYDWLAARIREKVMPEVLKSFSPNMQEYDLQYIVCAATGWADAILVSFSNSYAPIQLLLSLIRTTSAADVLEHCGAKQVDTTDVPKYAFLTTCTIPGTHIGSTIPTAAEEVDAICNKLAPWDHELVRFIVTAHAKPGHLNSAMDIFGSKAEDVFPTLGRSDFMVSSQADGSTSTYAHHRFFLQNLLPMPQSPLMWTETRFGFIGNIFRAERNPGGETQLCPTAAIPQQYEELDENGLIGRIVPPHTVRAFMQVGSSLQALAQHEATADCYESLIIGYNTAYRNAVDLAANLQVEPEFDYAGQLAKSLGRACECLDLCFKDRYRGAFPAGSTSAVPALASQASFHKCLAIVDGLSNAALDIIQRALRAMLPEKASEEHHQKFAVCCHLGNAPSPQIVVPHFLGVGFMNIPTDLMFAPGGIIYIFHEAGHVLWERLLLASEANVKQLLEERPTASYFVREIFCDLVTLSAVFRGDSQRMLVVLRDILRDLAMDGQYEQMKYRCNIAGILNEFLSTEESLTVNLLAAFKKISDDLAESNEKDVKFFDKVSKPLFETMLLLSAAWPDYVAALRSIKVLADLASVVDVSQAQRAPLEAVQGHFSQETSIWAPEEFTHLLWQLLRRASTPKIQLAPPKPE